jgi:hypothetical protein
MKKDVGFIMQIGGTYLKYLHSEEHGKRVVQITRVKKAKGPIRLALLLAVMSALL